MFASCRNCGVPEYVTIKEATQRAGIGRTTIYRLISLKLLHKHRSEIDTRHTYIDLEQLRELQRNPPMRRIE